MLKVATPPAQAAFPQADNGVTKQAQLVDEYNVGGSYVFDVAPGIIVQPVVELPVGAETTPEVEYHWQVKDGQPDDIDEKLKDAGLLLDE